LVLVFLDGGDEAVRAMYALQAIGRPAAEALQAAQETAGPQIQKRIEFALRGIPHA
jgi:hypothetical protein